MQRKYISCDLREAVGAAQQAEKGFKDILKQFAVHHFTVRTFFHKG